MNRVWTAAEVEDLRRAGGTQQIVLRPGDLISPHAEDVARGHGIEVRRDGGAPDDAAAPAAAASGCPCAGSGSPAACPRGGGCASSGGNEAERAVRSLAAAVASGKPDADAATVAQETLKALGAGGGVGIGSPEQAQPLPGLTLPKKAKGARPQFFADPALEAMVSTMVTLTSEVWTLRERVLTLEELLAKQRVLPAGAVDGHVVAGEEATVRFDEAKAFVARVLRVFYEWREEIVREETEDGYHEVIRRAFAQVKGEQA